MYNSYNKENALEREHLISLAHHLTDAQLCVDLEAGWTVSGVLAHLAFWDLRALTLLRKWKKDGMSPSPMDMDIVNEAMRELCNAIAPRRAAEMAVSCAWEIDQAIELLDEMMIKAIETDGATVHLNRGAHRKNHLGQIEKALQAKP